MTDFPPLPVDDTVLIVTHMQNDFVHKDGAGSHIAHSQMHDSGALSRIIKLLATCRQAGIPVIFHNETFRAGHPELREQRNGYVRGTGRVLGLPERNMCLRGAWGGDVVEELKPNFDRDEFIVDNSQVDPFTCTEFEVLLRNLRRNVLLVVGLATNYGVEMTARSGNERGYGICVVSDCIDRMMGEFSEMSIKHLLPIYGRVETADVIIKELEAPAK